MFIYLLMFIWICKSRLYRNFRLVFENNLGLYLDDNILRLLVFLLLKMDFLFWLRLERKAEGQLGRMEVESPWPDFSKFDHDPQQLFRPKVIFLWSRTTRVVLKCLKSIWASIFRELNPKAKAFWLWTKLSVLFTLKMSNFLHFFNGKGPKLKAYDFDAFQKQCISIIWYGVSWKILSQMPFEGFQNDSRMYCLCG